MNKEVTKKWKECLGIIRSRLNNDAAFSSWFEPTEARTLAGNRLFLRLPSMFCKELYEGQYFDLLSEAINGVFGPGMKLTYEVPIVAGVPKSSVKIEAAPKREPAVASEQGEEKKPAPKSRKKAAAESNAPEPESFMPQLNETLSFENYCVSACNKLPWTIAEAIARKPFNSDFNPFFLYGDVGVGKTHLMQAIGLHVRQQMPDKRVVFLPMREFQRLYQNAALRAEIPAFLQWFMRCDVLLFDDLQEIAGKEGTLNNALFPIFNHLHLHGKQLVFTCDRPPQDLKDMEERLIDRFKWGVVEKLERPDTALRKKILTFKAKKNGLALPGEVIEYISGTPLNSVREIEGIVLGMMTRAINLGREIDIDLAREVVGLAVKPSRKKTINFDMIVEAAAEAYNLNSDVIFSKSRVKDVADARMAIMYLGQHLLGLSTGSIGRKIGRKHSTVIHGIRTVTERMEQDRDFAGLIADIEKNL